MKPLLFVIIISLFYGASCKPVPGTSVTANDIQTTIKKLKLMQVINNEEAIAMIKHALDPALKRDWALGSVSADNLRILTDNPAFQQFIVLRGNDVKNNEPKTIAALYFAPAPGTPVGQATILYAEINVCPPPDASTCLKDVLDISYP